MAGLPKSIIKKYGVTKKAWNVYRAQHGKANKRKRRNRSTVRHMARKSRRKRVRSFLSYSTLSKFVRIGALVAPAIYAVTAYSTNQAKLHHGLMMYTGFDIISGQFKFAELLKGWTPFVATSAITYGVSKLNGIIRRL